MSDFGGGFASAGAQTAGNFIAEQQLDVMLKQLTELRSIVSGGGVISGILGSSLDVLKDIGAEIKKAQETVGPIVALVLEVEKIGQIIKGDVGLNLGSLVDVQRSIRDTLDQRVGGQISDAIKTSSQTVADATAKTAEAAAGVAAKTEAGAQTIAAAIAKANAELISRTVFGAFTPEALARISQIAVCHKSEIVEHEVLGPIEGFLETITKANICIVQSLLQPTIEVASKTADAVFRPFTTSVIGALDDMFTKLGQADPTTVDAVGGTILAKMIELGMAAHGLAFAADLVPALKVTGLSQVAAFLVDVAGFKVVGDAVVGEQIRAVLRQPMHYRSNLDHRPNLPELRDALEAWRKLAFSDQDLAQLIRFHGYPDEFVPFFQSVATREPRFLELASAFDDVEVSESWLVRAIQREGFRGEDVDQIHKAIIARSSRTFKKGLVDELVAVVKDGLHDVSWLQVNLRTLGFRPQTIQLISATATLSMTRAHAKDLANAWQTKAEQEVITLAEYRVALVSLGFTLTAVSAKVALVDAKLRGKVVKQEKAQLESVVRKTQAERSQRAIQLFRRGHLSDDQLHSSLLGLGFVESQVEAIVGLESARRLPVNKPTVDHEAQATQREILDARRDETLVLLRHDKINADQAFAMLVGLGIDPDLASALVERELARLKPPKSVMSQTPA